MTAGRPRTVDPSSRSPELKHYYKKRYGDAAAQPRQTTRRGNDEYRAKAEDVRRARKKNLVAFLSYRLSQTRGRAKLKSIPYSLTPEWLDAQPTVCAVTGQPFVVTDKGKGPLTPSFDRIDPKLGYTPENTRLVACWYNHAKLNWPDEDIQKLIISAAKFLT